uniref:uncharacterized protein LOC120335728 n=1 Tax=Styela clava TaxID=7725 RepID=UPI001939F895|nr:uncharacterized protein LOC120335728 [Styela clava]
MESIKEIISGYEGDEEAEKIMEFLKIKAPLLLFLCTTPVMLVYTLIALKFKSDFKPNTMTGIMIVVMQSILRSPHTYQENILEALGKLKELSYIGTVKRQVLFTEDDFRQVNLKPVEATDLAILAPGGIYRKLFQGIHLLYFQHQSIQEMLTSFYILGLDLKSFKKFVDKHLHTGHFVLIRKIMCGLLLNSTIYEAAGILLGEIKDLKKKQNILKRSLQFQLQKISNESDRLELFTALNEAKDGMSDIVKSSFDKIDMSRYPLSISDAHVIGSVASYCTLLTMNFIECDLKSASLQTLASGLKGSNLKIMKLRLDRNKNMGVEGLSSVGQILSNQSCVEELNLSYCNLSSDQLQAFKLSLGNNTEVINLQLYHNINMGVEGLSSVGQILSNQSCVEEVNLGYCNLSSDQLQTFKLSLGNNTEITQLRLNRNKNMGVEGLSSVGQILSNQTCVEELDLIYCNLSSNQLQAFNSSLGSTKIDWLGLDEDRTANHEDIVAVANLLPNVNEMLGLQGWKIADEDKELLQNQLDEIGSEELKIRLSGRTLKNQRRSDDATTDVIFERTITSEVDFGPTSPHGSLENTEENAETLREDRNPRSELLLTEEEVTEQAAKPTQHTLPQIENVFSQRSGSDILLTWDEVSDSNILYNVDIFCDDVKLRETHTTEIPQYRMKSPTLGKTYRFQVWAKDEWGNIGYKTQSKNVIKAKNIGVEGDTIDINECKVTFPDGTFIEQTKVWMSVRLDNSICPAQYVAITPVLDISAGSPLRKNAIVQMESWRLQLKKEDVDILHFTNDTDWNIIKPDLVSFDRTIEFRCQEFSRVIAAIKRWFYAPVLKENFLYTMGHNRICITFFSLSELVEKSIITYYESRGAQPVPTRFNQVILRHGDRIHLKLRIEGGPGELHFNEPNGHRFSVDDDFLTASRHDFEFLPNLQRYPEIVIKCEMEKNEDEINRKVIKFTFPLKPPERRGPPPINFAGANIGNLHLPERGNQNNQQMGQNEQEEAGAVGGNQAIE